MSIPGAKLLLPTGKNKRKGVQQSEIQGVNVDKKVKDAAKVETCISDNTRNNHRDFNDFQCASKTAPKGTMDSYKQFISTFSSSYPLCHTPLPSMIESKNKKTTFNLNFISLNYRNDVERNKGPNSQHLSHQLSPFSVKGLMNSNNSCYLAATMQSIVHCPPMAQVCVSAAFTHQYWQINCPPASNAQTCLAALLGQWILKQYWPHGHAAPLALPRGLDKVVLHRLGEKNEVRADGRGQEDVHEFITQLFSTLANDCLQLNLRMMDKRPVLQSDKNKDDSGGRWNVVGKGKEKLRVRQDDHRLNEQQAHAAANPVEAAVRGKLLFASKGAEGVQSKHVTSIVCEPFFSLSVPLSCPTSDSCPSLVDCMIHSVLSKEKITSNDAAGSEVTIKRETRLCFPPPPVLIIHLMRWAITREGEVVKLENKISVSPKIKIPAKLFSTQHADHSKIPINGVEYRLSSAICHRGAKNASGHYVTYVVCPTDRSHSDSVSVHLANDSRVNQSSMAELCADTPYVLWFVRI